MTTKQDFSRFTRNELIRTVRELNERQTRLLNQVAELQSRLDEADAYAYRPKFPWEQKQ